MTGPKVGDATHVVVTRTGGNQEITGERATELRNRFYPTLFRDGTENRVSTRVADNETPAIATPHTEAASGPRALDDSAIDLMVSGALAPGVSASRRAQTVKTLLLQDRPDAALRLLQGIKDQGQLGELLLELSTLDSPGTWTTRLALSASDPDALCRVIVNAPPEAYAAALSVLAPLAESDAGHGAIRQLLQAAARADGLEQLITRLDNMRTGEVATTREILVAAMAARGDDLSMLLLGASGEPITDPVLPEDKVEKPKEEESVAQDIKPVPALTPALVHEAIKAANPETLLSKVERGLREHPEAAQRALAALATLKSRGLVVVAEGSRAGGAAKEAYWGVISADQYADIYRDGITSDGLIRTRPGQTLEWELAEASRYVDEVLNCTYENGAWRSRTAAETVEVLRQRYPRVLAQSSDGLVHFGERITAPPYEIRGNQLVSSAATFTPAGFAQAIAETDLMLTFSDVAKAHPEIASYDGMKQLTVRTGSSEVRLEIRGDRVYSPDAPDDVRATGADVQAWVERVARPEPNRAPAATVAASTQPTVQALTDAARPWQANLRDQLGYAGLEFQPIGNNKVRMVLAEEGGTRHAVTDLSLVDQSGKPLSSSTLVANAELALTDYLITPVQPMPANAETSWRAIMHEANHYARSLGHAGVAAVPHGTDANHTTPTPFDPELTYDIYLIGKDGTRSPVANLKLATSGGTEIWTPAVCIRELRSGIFERHTALKPGAVDMTPADWTRLNGWLQNRAQAPITASVADGAVSWRDRAGGEFRVPLNLPNHVEVQVVDGNILRFVNTQGTFRAMGSSGLIETRDLYVGFKPGEAVPHDYLFGSMRGEFTELPAALDGLLFDSATTQVTIAGRPLTVRGPGLGGRVQLVSGLSASHSSILYDPASGKVELDHGWSDHQGVATLLDGDLSDGSIVVKVDYAKTGEGVQVWKLDVDLDGNDPGHSYDARCILNTTSVPIAAGYDQTDTEMARAELARLGVEYQASTRVAGFADVIGRSQIDGMQLINSLQTVPDAQVSSALNTLLALDPSRVTPPDAWQFSLRHLTTVESVIALDNPRGDETLRANMMLQLANAHDVFVQVHGDARAGTEAVRNLVRQAATRDLTGREEPGARLSIFLSLAHNALNQS